MVDQKTYILQILINVFNLESVNVMENIFLLLPQLLVIEIFLGISERK